MIYVQAIMALIPLISQLIGLFIKTPDEQKAEFLKQLPVKLVELHNAFLQQTQNHDPSGVNKQLNGG